MAEKPKPENYTYHWAEVDVGAREAGRGLRGG